MSEEYNKGDSKVEKDRLEKYLKTIEEQINLLEVKIDKMTNPKGIGKLFSIKQVNIKEHNDKLCELRLKHKNIKEAITFCDKKIELDVKIVPDYENSEIYINLTTALIIARRIKISIDEAVKSIKTASNMSFSDLVGTNRFLNYIKRGSLCETQVFIQVANSDIKLLEETLGQVNMDEVMVDINVDSKLFLADYLLDSYTISWSAYDKVNTAKKEVLNAQNRIDTLISKIESDIEVIKKG